MNLIRIFYIIAIAVPLAHCNSVASSADAWIREKFNSLVAVHFRRSTESYRSLLDAILSDISNPDADAIVEVSTATKEATKSLESHLITASTNCQSLIADVRCKLMAKVRDVDNLEKKMVLQENRLNEDPYAALDELEKLRQKKSVAVVSRNLFYKYSDQLKRSLMVINRIKASADQLKLSADLGYYLDLDHFLLLLKEIGQTLASQDYTKFLPKLTEAQINKIKEKLQRIKASG